MNDNKLGNIISGLRKEKGLTQKDLAKVLNISDKAISRWERGTSYPNLETIFLISRYFEVSFNDLLTARVDTDNSDDKLVEEIIKEFSEIGKKRNKRIKRALFISLITILILTIAIIFTNTYNRFKVYKVHTENSEIMPIYGLYVETNIRDILYLGDLEIKDYKQNINDSITVDIYIKENNEEKILHSYTDLDNIYLVGTQSYIEIDNFSEYFDNLFLRITIINSNSEKLEYISKLDFVKDFSNNKIFYEDNDGIETVNYSTSSLDQIDIQIIFLENGFYESGNSSLIKETKNEIIKYFNDSNIISYSYEKNSFTYRYNYHLNNDILEVLVFDENSTEIEKYKYELKTDKMNCYVGSCTDYEKVLKILDEKVLYLLKN